MRPRTRSWNVLTFAALAAAAACARPADTPSEPAAAPAPPGAAYVGAAACAGCHEKEVALWKGSDHALAMQPAAAATVAADFKSSSFTYNRVRSTFSVKSGQYVVRTDGPDGTLHDYRIAYTFGVRPLQQYLLEFPRGRYQALSIAWDNRSRAQGGQRWFHLYPDDKIGAGDVLHWTGSAQNWNYMCAECHSTGLEKRYHPAGDTYETTWSEINVSCEACHGPASRHVEWGRLARAGKPPADAARGLAVALKDLAAGWARAAGQTVATRTNPASAAIEVETCGRCHARRAQLWPDHAFGQPLAQSHEVSLIDEGLYEADGQIRDEVYEYGSFLQSRMYAAGVTCSNCHDPHSGRRLAAGNALCTQCHLQKKYDAPSHHFHRAGTDGASCESCHMPERVYMLVDGRRDHGFRVPRPDLTVSIGTPNACTDCHENRSPRWAADAVVKWYGPAAATRPSFAPALHAARARRPEGLPLLRQVLAAATTPPIVRATAVTLVPRYSGPAVGDAISQAATDKDPLVRRAAASVLDVLEPVTAVRIGAALLRDPIRTVRLAAVLPLAGEVRSLFDPDARAAFDRAVEEFRQAQQFNADRAEAHVNLAALDTQLGRHAEAEPALRTAIRMQPHFVPAHVNLADLLRATGREREAEAALRNAIARLPGAADLHSALGLSLVRQGRPREALADLSRASELAPDNPRYTYMYAVALHDMGDARRALRVLTDAQARHPGDRDILQGLVSYEMESGNAVGARQWAEKIVDVAPGDPAALEQLRSLQRIR